MPPDRPPNHLITETSPYLLQHAHNPVKWHPWGEPALAKARAEDKPILLSIGYSACHWCHVMERESFEDEAIARLMNEHYVNIKVDREERPDLDQIYMSAVQMMTGGGGWPLTVFLTPAGEPFFGGTYFPPEDRYNRPGFPKVLHAIAEAYRSRRDEVAANARTLIEQINAQASRNAVRTPLDEALLDEAVAGLAARFDAAYGGFGSAPKFPPGMAIDFLLRRHDRTRDARALAMAQTTLDRMGGGGLYDHVGGGFHRYSTDARWLVPHFEKMLYDNALLVSAYLDAYAVTGQARYAGIVRETLAWVLREMRDPAGGFYSTLDADSEGVEGRFYVWGQDEFLEVTGPDGALLARYLDVSAAGNFEGHNILNTPHPPAEFAAAEGIDPGVLERKLAEAKGKLFARREGRVRPGRDEKILTDWNGLMLKALARAAGRLGEPAWRRAAETNAEFLISRMWDGRRLQHAFKDGAARFNGYLDDYANLADGLLALYELTFDARWFEASLEVAERMIDEFWDPVHGGFYFTGRSHESLVARTKEYFDNATPAGNSVAADVLARLGALLDRDDFRDRARRVTESVVEYVRRHPSGFGRLLAAADFLIGPSREIAIAGDPAGFLPVLQRSYLPRTVVAAGDGDGIALLRDRPAIDGRSAAYVCENYVCQAPVTDPASLAALLQRG